MTPNPARAALSRAVNRAIAEGAPVYQEQRATGMTHAMPQTSAVAGPFGLPFARCDYPPAEDDNATPHPVVAAYHLKRESAP